MRRAKQTRQQRTVITGSKTGARIKAVARKVRIFVTRLDPDVTVEGLKEYALELTGSDCDIETLEAKGPNYASFVICCNKDHEEKILNAAEWEEGVLLRQYFGKLPSEQSRDECPDP